MRTLFAAILFAAGLWAAVVLLTREEDEPVEASLSVAAALSTDTAGYARVLGPRPFRFPEDHGPHPDFRTEWWYYTGNVTAGDGRRFAYQFTLFRTALAPPDSAGAARQRPASLSSVRDTSGSSVRDTSGNWATRQLYMAHFALTDEAGGEHVAFERFSRGAAGLAGAEADPYRLWLEDWSVDGLNGADSVSIRVSADGYRIDLVLRQTKPVVLQGDEGFDPKGPLPGDASYYFSMTRMATRGTIASGGEAFDVQGWSWMDREWSTSALSANQVGWDWFSLQFENDVELMYYRLRQADGSTSPFSSGSVVGPDGKERSLDAADVRLEVLDTWISPVTGIRYPSDWRLRVAATETLLEIEPLVADQELDLSIRYWEGAVRVKGTHQGNQVMGTGFVEMTGYGEESTP